MESYSVVRDGSTVGKLSAHITFGYVVDRMTEQQVDCFMDVLAEVNERHAAIELPCGQGVVMAFSDMNTYWPVCVPQDRK